MGRASKTAADSAKVIARSDSGRGSAKRNKLELPLWARQVIRGTARAALFNSLRPT